MRQKYFVWAFVFQTCWILCGCKSLTHGVGNSAGDKGAKRTELYFGLKTRDGMTISEAQWRSFLDMTVAPRFQEGFTVFTADGRWQDANHQTHVEPTRVIVVLYPSAQSSVTDEKIAAIARDYIARFDQDSVLRSDTRANMTFYTPISTNRFR